MNKLWLVLRNTETHRSWTKYFIKEKEMDSFLDKIKFIKNIKLVEDSRDIVYY